jgi:hypothetical protein
MEGMAWWIAKSEVQKENPSFVAMSCDEVGSKPGRKNGVWGTLTKVR